MKSILFALLLTCTTTCFAQTPLSFEAENKIQDDVRQPRKEFSSISFFGGIGIITGREKYTQNSSLRIYHVGPSAKAGILLNAGADVRLLPKVERLFLRTELSLSFRKHRVNFRWYNGSFAQSLGHVYQTTKINLSPKLVYYFLQTPSGRKNVFGMFVGGGLGIDWTDYGENTLTSYDQRNIRPEEQIKFKNVNLNIPFLFGFTFDKRLEYSVIFTLPQNIGNDPRVDIQVQNQFAIGVKYLFDIR